MCLHFFLLRMKVKSSIKVFSETELKKNAIENPAYIISNLIYRLEGVLLLLLPGGEENRFIFHALNLCSSSS